MFGLRKCSRWVKENDGIDLLDSDRYSNNTNSYQVIEKMATHINSARDCLAVSHNKIDSKLVGLQRDGKIVGNSNLFQQALKNQQASAGYTTVPILGGW